jgi:hypothetical protein
MNRRMTARQQNEATKKLLDILKSNPTGTTTAGLANAVPELSHQQIVRLLRESGMVNEGYDPQSKNGYNAAILWKHKIFWPPK